MQTQLPGKLLFPPNPNSSPSTTYKEILRLPLPNTEVGISITRKGGGQMSSHQEDVQNQVQGREPERDAVTSMGETKICPQSQEASTVTRIRVQGTSQADSCGAGPKQKIEVRPNSSPPNLSTLYSFPLISFVSV